MAALKLIILTGFVLLLVASLRLLYVLPRFRSRPQRRRRGSGSHLVISLGSGGHTAEMIYMLDKAVFGPPNQQASKTDNKKLLAWSDYTHRTWIVSSGDSVSAIRAKEFEDKVRTRDEEKSGTFKVVTVPRARKIYQPLWTSPFSCLHCAWACFGVLTGSKHGPPDLILTNGPATATVLIFTSVIMRALNIGGCHSKGKMRTIYVESWARVKGLSLSGKLLCWVADRVLVQWAQLKGAGGRAEFHGVLCF